jgi:hypothetical protein
MAHDTTDHVAKLRDPTRPLSVRGVANVLGYNVQKVSREALSNRDMQGHRIGRPEKHHDLI